MMQAPLLLIEDELGSLNYTTFYIPSFRWVLFFILAWLPFKAYCWFSTLLHKKNPANTVTDHS